jgi:hypothetical protein
MFEKTSPKQKVCSIRRPAGRALLKPHTLPFSDAGPELPVGRPLRLLLEIFLAEKTRKRKIVVTERLRRNHTHQRKISPQNRRKRRVFSGNDTIVQRSQRLLRDLSVTLFLFSF